jgi:HSP20 family molecular chaperone IbpA
MWRRFNKLFNESYLQPRRFYSPFNLNRLVTHPRFNYLQPTSTFDMTFPRNTLVELTYPFFDSTDYTPKVSEDDFKYLLELEIPGVDEKSLSVEINSNILNIKIDQTSESYHRSINLDPETMNIDEIDAEHTHGILKINIPKNFDDKLTKSKVLI